MGAQEKSQTTNNSMQRVKVYRLNDDGKWDDQGTGHVTVDYLERSEELGLFVIDEEDNETLLLHRISSEDIYRKQEDTIISWRDPEFSTELALSFQETTGCSHIWDHICAVQRNLHINSLNNEAYHSINNDLRELPAVEISTLPLILKTVVECGIADQMHVAELMLNEQEFFRKLTDLFRICEDLENIDGLHMIFKIVRGIILFNSPQIFEKIFGDELAMDIIGALEYDPDVPEVQSYRSFLKEHVVFKEAIPIKDPVVLSKIHQTYRIGYLKDVILHKVLDDATIANLTSMVHSNNAAVVSLLKDDSTFIQELFGRLKSSTTTIESKRNLVLFLHEFCCASKSLQMVQQHRLFRDLVNEGIFDVIADVLQSHDKKLSLVGTDILILFVNQDPNILRSYVSRQEGASLLGLLVKGMITDFGDDMHCQFLEILRSLLDSYTSGTQRDTILEIFYERHLGELIDVITSSCAQDIPHQSNSRIISCNGSRGDHISVKPEILLNIVDLLCFCILHHPFRIKCSFLLNNVVDKVLFLTHRREKYLVVAAVRFFRTLISRNDEHLMSYIVKHNLLKPIVEAFIRNGDRYNLLNSAVLELFEYIRKENLKTMLKYLVESFWDQLARFSNLASISSLKIKYEQSVDISGMESSASEVNPRKRIEERTLEKEEEDYFNEDSDEEDSASAPVLQSPRVQTRPVLSNGSAPSHPSNSPRFGGLVDYEDDEDDEDYKPPPRKQFVTSDDDEGTVDSFPLKRKAASMKEEQPESVKKQRIFKSSKPKESVFAALCSTLSQAVLPGKRISNTIQNVPCSQEVKNSLNDRLEKESVRCKDEEKNEKELTDTSSHSDDILKTSPENKAPIEEDCPIVPPKASPEMAVNGS